MCECTLDGTRIARVGGHSFIRCLIGECGKDGAPSTVKLIPCGKTAWAMHHRRLHGTGKTAAAMRAQEQNRTDLAALSAKGLVSVGELTCLVPCDYSAPSPNHLMQHLISHHVEVDSLLVKRRDERLKENTCQYPGCNYRGVEKGDFERHIKMKKHRVPQGGGAAADAGQESDADEQ
jgi:hypothetical protein